MLRKLFALLVSGALAFGAMSPASAQSDIANQTSTVPARTAAPTLNTPLAPGAAAGIKQAQGAQRNRIWNFAPFGVVGGLALLVVLTGGDDDDSSTTTTTGTN